MERADRNNIIFIGNTFVGNKYAFIYIIFSKKHRIAYVGQTNEKRGVIGRFLSHLDSEGTFRKYFETSLGIPLEEVDDLTIFSYNLGNEPKYTSIETRFREGVEYLVYKELYSLELQPSLILKGNVRYNDSCLEKEIITTSEDVISCFIKKYS